MDKTTQDKFNKIFTKERYSNGQRIDIEKFVSEIIVGATAENERLQPIIDALDQFISYHESGLLPARHVYEKAVTARKQWKDGKKEVCTCDNIQLAAHGECWGCPGRDTREKEVGDE